MTVKAKIDHVVFCRHLFKKNEWRLLGENVNKRSHRGFMQAHKIGLRERVKLLH